VISPVDGASCDFYPTCSAYAKQALAKHGLFIGLAMASERLCRIHAPEGYEPVEKCGNYYYYDPVENNDFWFYTRRAGIP
jgi:putative component of membrane protein insertase Oxa1/YidC/SpoIIIJ protein YidD